VSLNKKVSMSVWRLRPNTPVAAMLWPQFAIWLLASTIPQGSEPHFKRKANQYCASEWNFKYEYR